MTETVEQLTADDFDAKLDPGMLHLVDFWADWCAPCHAMHPVLEELAAEFAGRVKVSKIDVHDHQAVGDRFQISSLPTFIIFRDGQPVTRISGVKRRPQLARELEALLT